MKLPNADWVLIDPRKLHDYLLSTDHPVGRFKAQFFDRLGFTAADWDQLRSELRSVVLESEAEAAERTDHGQKYIVRGTVSGKVGRGARVVTVWIILHDEESPRFVTAYPER